MDSQANRTNSTCVHMAVRQCQRESEREQENRERESERERAGEREREREREREICRKPEALIPAGHPDDFCSTYTSVHMTAAKSTRNALHRRRILEIRALWERHGFGTFRVKLVRLYLWSFPKTFGRLTTEMKSLKHYSIQHLTAAHSGCHTCDRASRLCGAELQVC